MTKVLGALLVVLGGGLLGSRMGKRLGEEVRALEEFSRGLALLEGELALSQAPLDRLLDRVIPLCQGHARRFFHSAREALDRLEEEPFSHAWTRLAGELPLEEEACRALAALGDCLGRWDSGEQGRALSAARRRLEELAAQGREEARRQGRLWPTLGLSGGVFLAILLL